MLSTHRRNIAPYGSGRNCARNTTTIITNTAAQSSTFSTSTSTSSAAAFRSRGMTEECQIAVVIIVCAAIVAVALEHRRAPLDDLAAPPLHELDECVSITQASLPFVVPVAWAVRCYRVVEPLFWTNATAAVYALVFRESRYVRNRRFYFDSHPIEFGPGTGAISCQIGSSELHQVHLVAVGNLNDHHTVPMLNVWDA